MKAETVQDFAFFCLERLWNKNVKYALFTTVIYERGMVLLNSSDGFQFLEKYEVCLLVQVRWFVTGLDLSPFLISLLSCLLIDNHLQFQMLWRASIFKITSFSVYILLVSWSKSIVWQKLRSILFWVGYYTVNLYYWYLIPLTMYSLYLSLFLYNFLPLICEGLDI